MRESCLLVLVGMAICATPCHASTIVLDTGPGNVITYRTSDSGLGQPVLASDAITITGMAMDLFMPAGGDIQYMIWNNTNSVLLFSEEQAVAASNTPVFVQSAPFSFNLSAGDIYYFGVISDNSLNVQYITPSVPVTQNGLTALLTGNSNYVNFGVPTYSGPGFVEVALQLYGSDDASAPEPASWLTAVPGVILVVLFQLFMKDRRRFPHALQLLVRED